MMIVMVVVIAVIVVIAVVVVISSVVVMIVVVVLVMVDGSDSSDISGSVLDLFSALTMSGLKGTIDELDDSMRTSSP